MDLFDILVTYVITSILIEIFITVMDGVKFEFNNISLYTKNDSEMMCQPRIGILYYIYIVIINDFKL